MATNQLSFRSSIVPFFGGDSDAATTFFASTYPANNWSSPLNTEQQPDTILDVVGAYTMFAQMYNDFPGTGKGEFDIHQEYTDFVVRTALFHKELDKATKVGPVHEALKASFAEAIRNRLNRKMSDLMGSLGSNFQNLLDQPADGVSNGAVPPPSMVGITGQSTYLDYIITQLFSIANQITDANVRSVDTFLQTPIDHLSTSARGFSSIKADTELVGNRFKGSVVGFIDALIGKCGTDDNTPNIVNSSLGDFCLSRFDDGNKSAATNLDAILRRAYNDPAREQVARRAYLDEFLTNAFKEFANYILTLYSKAGGISVVKQALANAMGAGGQINLGDFTAIISRAINDTNSKEKFIQNLAGMSHTALMGHVNISTSITQAYTTLAQNLFARQVYEAVFLNWKQIDPNARDFYMEHLHLFKKAEGTTSFTKEATGWTDQMLHGDPVISNLDNSSELRVNLMKASKVSSDTMFCNTLPFLPSTTRKVWYTDSRGVVKSITANVNAIKDIYRCVYAGEGCRFDGVFLELPNNFSIVARNMNDFNLDHMKMAKLAMKLSDKVSVSRPGSTQSGTFDNIFENIVTHLVYERDAESKLYRTVNGTRVYCTQDDLTLENCIGTRLKGDRQKCSKFVHECLLSGDAMNLHNCLEYYKNRDMFAVAAVELENIDPNIAVKILKAFGVQQKIENDYITVQSYDDWLRLVVPSLGQAFRDTLLANTNLLDYLRGVISFVQTNPAILNKNVSASTYDKDLVALGKTRPFVTPTETTSSRSFNGLLLRNSALVGAPAALPPLPWLNVASSPIFPVVGMQAGGGSDTISGVNDRIKNRGLSSDVLYVAFDSLIKDLARTGSKINELDSTRINNGFTQLAGMEKKIIRLYNALSGLTEILNFYKRASDGADLSVSTNNISASKLMRKTDVIQLLLKNIADMETCYGNNWAARNKLCAEIATALADISDASAK